MTEGSLRLTSLWPIILSTLALSGCGLFGQPPAHVFLIDAAKPGRCSPKNFLAGTRTVPSGQISGFFVEGDQIHVILLLDGELFTFALAKGAVPPTRKPAALRVVALAAQYDWTVSAAYPITNSSGELQVDVMYDTGLACVNLAQEIQNCVLR